ncbi:ATP synthase F0 subunit A [bacterium]|nr:ATP synthase F0 subunit A [bacterium]|tara:strand:+ start:4312 stop:5046 length:735 start_codon:yes stop_codon:yes gene_type:complete
MEISLAAEPIFKIGSFIVTNALLTSWIVVAILCLFAWRINKKLEKIPGKMQSVLEEVFEWVINMIKSLVHSRKKAKMLFPILITFFIFIMISNWFGLMPGIGPIGVWQEHNGEQVLVPLFRGTNADLNATLAWAIISVVAGHIFGIIFIGGIKYGKRYFNLKNPIMGFVGFLEIIGEFAKMVSFSFRLYGNIFAGEVLLIVIAVLVPYIAPLPFYFLEIFVGFIQALVFTMLSMVFYSIAVSEH